MAFFPASPTNGQQATVGNIVYQWNSTSNVWNRVGTTVVQLVDGSLVTITGNLLVTGSGSSQFSSNLISLANVVASNNVVGVRGVFSGNVSGSNITTTGNVLATGNIVTPNLYVTRIYGNGQFSTSGTVTAGDITGSSVTATGNVQANQNVNTGGNVNATGNVTGTNFLATGNVTVNGTVSGNDALLANVFVGNANATGNVAATYFLGNGALLTGVVTGGGGAGNRANASISTGSIANSVTFTGNVTLAKGYAVYKVTTSTNAWVRLYSNTTTQTSDAARSMFNDPQPGAGVMVEVISTGSNVIVVSPAAVGWNDSNPVSNSIPVSITNLSGTSSNITVTFTYLGLEI